MSDLNRWHEKRLRRWLKESGRRAAATNDRRANPRVVRAVFADRYDRYMRGRTIMEALRQWRLDGGEGPLFPAGSWQFSGGWAEVASYE